MLFNCSDTHVLEVTGAASDTACEADGRYYYCIRYPCGPDKMYNTCGLDVLCRMRHPHLQRAEHLHVDGTACVLLLPVYTGTLKRLMRKQFSIADKLARLFPLLSALAFLHRNRVCHGSIDERAVLFSGDHAWLCDLSKCSYGTGDARRDIVDLGRVFASVLYEEGVPAFPSTRAESASLQLLGVMLDSANAHTAQELCCFPAFDHCRENYCTWLETRPASPPAAFDEDHRQQLKAFLHCAATRFPEIPLAHLFRVAAAAKRCQGVAGTEALLYTLLFMSLRTGGPRDPAAFCALVDAEGVTADEIKHLQLPIIKACDGVLWTNHVYDCCLNRDQVERAYFSLLLAADPATLANADPELYPHFLGPAVRCVSEWTQGDVADLL